MTFVTSPKRNTSCFKKKIKFKLNYILDFKQEKVALYNGTGWQKETE